AGELIIANKELAFQNEEKEKRAEELIIANKELAFQNNEKEERAVELIIAKEKAEESDRLKSAFLANMSHEVRTPLNNIIGFSELLTDPYFEEEHKNEFITHIITNGNNLLSIISDIMDISKIESGEIKIRNSQINLLKFISDVEANFSFKAKEKNIELKLSIPENDEGTIIVADTDRLSQVMNNLIGNALKFTSEGKIEIGYQPKGKMVEFFVHDTGIGIPAEFHDHIFKRFRQVEGEKTRKYGGNGLGLAITKNLVELMGGKIRLESKVGEGSKFYFTMPGN
ncbi:MAG: ATP-binding protein, partial [Bacteroidota bacterium]|nr:ATP-binding protein [Bacteroidota bacterium]